MYRVYKTHDDSAPGVLMVDFRGVRAQCRVRLNLLSVDAELLQRCSSRFPECNKVVVRYRYLASIRITLVSSVEEGLRGDCHLSFFLSLPVSDNEVDVIYSFPWKSCPLCSNPFSNT